MFSSLIPIHLLITILPTWKHSATVAREARVQAQEVGVSNLTRFSQGDTGWGYLVVTCIKIFQVSLYTAAPCEPVEWKVHHTWQTQGH